MYRAVFSQAFSTEHSCSARYELVFRKKLEKQKKNIDFLLNLNLAYLITVQNTVNIIIFMRPFHLVTNICRCTGFYLTNAGLQHVCVPSAGPQETK